MEPDGNPIDLRSTEAALSRTVCIPFRRKRLPIVLVLYSNGSRISTT
jgi:hypothetical protein